jgi:hypothetical protein
MSVGQREVEELETFLRREDEDRGQWQFWLRPEEHQLVTMLQLHAFGR